MMFGTLEADGIVKDLAIVNSYYYVTGGAKVALCARDWENINLNASQRDTVWGWLNNASTTEIIVADPSDVTLEFPYVN